MVHVNHLPAPRRSLLERTYGEVATMAARGAFAGNHVLSMRQYNRTDLELLFRTADWIRKQPAGVRKDRPLGGQLLMSAFFDTSTRTRLAHETAMIRLGGAVAGFADPSVTRAGGSTAESDDDVLRMMDIYG